MVLYSLNDNKRVRGVNESTEGCRPHQGDPRSSGISELGRISKPDGRKTDAVTATHPPKLAINTDIKDLQYRKLTPVECERLQTLPDNYTEGVSSTQRYRMLGNGWTVDVIKHIFDSIVGKELLEGLY